MYDPSTAMLSFRASVVTPRAFAIRVTLETQFPRCICAPGPLLLFYRGVIVVHGDCRIEFRRGQRSVLEVLAILYRTVISSGYFDAKAWHFPGYRYFLREASSISEPWPELIHPELIMGRLVDQDVHVSADPFLSNAEIC